MPQHLRLVKPQASKRMTVVPANGPPLSLPIDCSVSVESGRIVWRNADGYEVLSMALRDFADLLPETKLD